MNGVNNVTLIGNVGYISSFTTSTNKKVLNISVATTEKFYSQIRDEKKSDTQWHSVVLWNKLCELGERLITKGCLVYIDGRISYRKKDDGTMVAEIIAKNIRVLSKSESDSELIQDLIPNIEPLDYDNGMDDFGSNY